jgi:outer membrane protein assembly factor BamE (lipoprotein component of BamABCDE complex)
VGIGGYFAVLGAILVTGVLVSFVLFLRTRKKTALLGVIATVLVGGAWYAAILVDGFASVVIFPQDTIYSSSYSEEAFQKIKQGDLRRTVLNFLGKPLSRSVFTDDHTEYWYYSKHGPRHDNYWNKIVVFDSATGQVIKKVDEFYSD